MRRPQAIPALPWLHALLAIVAAGCALRQPPVKHLRAEDAVGPYSGAVLAGDLLFVSGKIGAERGGSFEWEVHSAIDALEQELARSGAALDDVLSVTAYLTDISLYERFNTVYAERFEPPHPARACVAVTALPAGARVELQAIARRSRSNAGTSPPSPE